MKPTDALREIVRENAQAGIEYAADILRAEGFSEAARLVSDHRHELASHIADIDGADDYERSAAMRAMVGIVEGVKP